MSDLFLAPTAAAGALLVLAGPSKLGDPRPLIRALRSTGLGTVARPMLVRAAAAAEIAVGLWAVIHPDQLSAGMVALAYAAFMAFILLARRAPGGVVSSCGCFGKADTPPTLAHALATAALSLAAVGAIVTGAAGWHLAAPTTLLIGLGGLIAFLAWQTMAVLPLTTSAAIRSISPTRSAS